MSDPNRLPANFKSLYRLFLRTASASVLHHPRASRNLRRRWRPTFNDAARVTREVQRKHGYESESGTRKGGVEWLRLWHERMDNTLELLYTSSHSRGIPNLVTRALSFATEEERRRAFVKLYARTTWRPSDPQAASQHLRKPKNVEKRKEQEVMEYNSLGALDELLQMAEATSNLTLGTNTVPLGRYVYRRPRK